MRNDNSTYSALSPYTMHTYLHTMKSTETFDLSLWSLAPAYPFQQPNLCRNRCVSISTKFNQPLNDLGLTVSIDTNSNSMTVTSTNELNDQLTFPVSIVAVLPPTGLLNCQFYYPIVSLKMFFLTSLVPPAAISEVRFDPFNTKTVISYQYQLPLYSMTNSQYANDPGFKIVQTLTLKNGASIPVVQTFDSTTAVIKFKTNLQSSDCVWYQSMLTAQFAEYRAGYKVSVNFDINVCECDVNTLTMPTSLSSFQLSPIYILGQPALNFYFDPWDVIKPYCTKTPGTVPYSLQSISPTTSLPSYIDISQSLLRI